MLTVLLATHNGASTLPRTLDAFRALQPPLGGHHFLIVDNASNDHTADILRQHGAGLPLQVLYCAERGKNKALNQGISSVQGDLVVFTDDDVLPQQDWLVKMAFAAAEHADFAIFGGHIVGDWPADIPEWIPRLVNLSATFGITPLELESGPIEAGQAWGANMAVRRHVFDAGNRFNETIGPSAGQYIMGSESEFNNRMEREGHRAWFVAEAVVAHIIRQHQMTPEWILQRAYRFGRGWYRHECTQFKADFPMIRGVPRWKYREWAEYALQLIAGRLVGDFDRTFKAKWNLSFMRGYFDEAARIGSKPTPN